MKLRWGLVSTVKASEDQVLAFVAHHLSLGASRIWLYFDDPDDPAFDRVAKLPRVTATRCTDKYWDLRGGRDTRHQTRQTRNTRDALRMCKLDWLGHIDVDEFLHAPRPVADILAEVPAETPALVMEPFDAMHDPDLPDDIFTARHFRGPLGRAHRALHPMIFGPAAPIIPGGNLGHTIGKSFSRPGVKGLALRIHLVAVNKVRLTETFNPELRLLHFHAQDPAAWRAALPFRLDLGAYHWPKDKLLHDYLANATDEAIGDFYQAVQTLTPEKVALLEAHGRLITADLGLRSKVAALLNGPA